MLRPGVSQLQLGPLQQARLMFVIGGNNMQLTVAYYSNQSGAGFLEALLERACWGPSYERRGTQL